MEFGGVIYNRKPRKKGRAPFISGLQFRNRVPLIFLQRRERLHGRPKDAEWSGNHPAPGAKKW